MVRHLIAIYFYTKHFLFDLAVIYYVFNLNKLLHFVLINIAATSEDHHHNHPTSNEEHTKDSDETPQQESGPLPLYLPRQQPANSRSYQEEEKQKEQLEIEHSAAIQIELTDPQLEVECESTKQVDEDPEKKHAPAIDDDKVKDDVPQPDLADTNDVGAAGSPKIIPQKPGTLYKCTPFTNLNAHGLLIWEELKVGRGPLNEILNSRILK